MKTILLLRHGKSDWNTAEPTDHERPLAPRGVKAARRMGRFLAGVDPTPDAVYTSSAVRAAETARLSARAAAWTCPLEIVPALYDTSARDVLDLVRSLDDALECALLVGHEPWCSSLVELLTGATVRFPTAAAARIDVDVAAWTRVRPRDGSLAWLVTPRLLPRGLSER